MQFSDNFTTAFEKELAKRADRMLDQFLKEIDVKMEDRLEVLLKDAFSLLAQSMNGVGQPTSAGTTGTNGLSAQFAQGLNNVIQSAIGVAFAQESTERVSTQETGRSTQVNAEYKQSRSQQQSTAAQQINRGNRNL